MKINEVLSNLKSYEKFLQEIGSPKSNISKISKTINFLQVFSDYTFEQLESMIMYQRKNNSSPLNLKLEKRKSKSGEFELANLINKLKSTTITDSEKYAILSNLEHSYPRVHEILALDIKELPEYYYNQKFEEWKPFEIKFMLMYFFGTSKIGRQGKKELLELLANQIYQYNYVNDLKINNKDMK